MQMSNSARRTGVRIATSAFGLLAMTRRGTCALPKKRFSACNLPALRYHCAEADMVIRFPARFPTPQTHKKERCRPPANRREGGTILSHSYPNRASRTEGRIATSAYGLILISV